MLPDPEPSTPSPWPATSRAVGAAWILRGWSGSRGRGGGGGVLLGPAAAQQAAEGAAKVRAAAVDERVEGRVGIA